MSEINKPSDSETDMDPIDQVLNIETPAVNDTVAGKKKSSPLAKFGLPVAAAGLVMLVGSQFYPWGGQSKGNGAQGTAQLRANDVQGFRPTTASTKSTNPEATELGLKTESERAAVAAKDPAKSFVSVPPFDAAKSDPFQPDTKTLPPPPPAVNLQAQAQPIVPVVQSGNGQQEDPTLAFARKIYNDAISSPAPGLSAPNAAAVQAAAVSAQGQAITGKASNVEVLDATVAAGEIKYGILTSGLNTRVPQTPPRAVIHGGVLDGGVMLGVMENADDQYMVLRFKTLTLGKKTYPIEAIAVNPDMQDAGLADEVKSHRLEKTAIQAGVGFIQAFGAAKLQEGATMSSSTGPNGSTSFSQTPNRTNKQTALIALGGAAQAISPAIDQAVNSIKPEVIIHPNKEMGILFIKSLYLQQ